MAKKKVLPCSTEDAALVFAQTIEHMLASFGCKPSDFQVAVLKAHPEKGAEALQWLKEYHDED
jgi:hypothetical protein